MPSHASLRKRALDGETSIHSSPLPSDGDCTMPMLSTSGTCVLDDVHPRSSLQAAAAAATEVPHYSNPLTVDTLPSILYAANSNHSSQPQGEHHHDPGSGPAGTLLLPQPFYDHFQSPSSMSPLMVVDTAGCDASNEYTLLVNAIWAKQTPEGSRSSPSLFSTFLVITCSVVCVPFLLIILLFGLLYWGTHDADTTVGSMGTASFTLLFGCVLACVVCVGINGALSYYMLWVGQHQTFRRCLRLAREAACSFQKMAPLGMEETYQIQEEGIRNGDNGCYHPMESMYGQLVTAVLSANDAVRQARASIPVASRTYVDSIVHTQQPPPSYYGAAPMIRVSPMSLAAGGREGGVEFASASGSSAAAAASLPPRRVIFSDDTVSCQLPSPAVMSTSGDLARLADASQATFLHRVAQMDEGTDAFSSTESPSSPSPLGSKRAQGLSSGNYHSDVADRCFVLRDAASSLTYLGARRHGGRVSLQSSYLRRSGTMWAPAHTECAIVACKAFFPHLSSVEKDRAAMAGISSALHKAAFLAASETDGVPYDVQFDSVLLLYNAFLPLPRATLLRKACHAALKISASLTSHGLGNATFGIVLMESHMLLRTIRAQSNVRFAYSASMQQALDLCRLCPMLGCAVVTPVLVHGFDNIYSIPVDIIMSNEPLSQSQAFSYVYTLTSDAQDGRREVAQACGQALQSMHQCKYAEALHQLAPVASLSTQAKRLDCIVRKILEDPSESVLPYWRHWVSWNIPALVKTSAATHKSSEGLAATSHLSRLVAPSKRLHSPLSSTKLFPVETKKTASFNDSRCIQGPSRHYSDCASTFTPLLSSSTSKEACERPFTAESGDESTHVVRQTSSMGVTVAACSTSIVLPAPSHPTPSPNIIRGRCASSDGIIKDDAAAALRRETEARIVLPSDEDSGSDGDGDDDEGRSGLSFRIGDTLPIYGSGKRSVLLAMGRNGIVAVKRISVDVDADEVKDAQREIDVLCKLAHPNIVRYIARGQRDNCLWIVMEYVSGGTLADIVYDFGPRLPLPTIRRYTRDILKALAYLHERPVGGCIVHRDVSIFNVMVTVNGVCKLTDFGGAVECSKNRSAASYQSPSSPHLSTTSRGGGGGGGGVRSLYEQQRRDHPTDSLSPLHSGNWEATHTMTAFLETDGDHGARREKIFGTPVFMSPQACMGTVDPKIGIIVFFLLYGHYPYPPSSMTDHIVFMNMLARGQLHPEFPPGPATMSDGSAGNSCEMDSDDAKEFMQLCLRAEASQRPNAKDLLMHSFMTV